MDIARVIGTVWCSVKDPLLDGQRLALIQPLDENFNDNGEPAVAMDQLNRSEGEIVYIVRSGDAMFAHHGDHNPPVDCAIAGLVDSVYLEKKP